MCVGFILMKCAILYMENGMDAILKLGKSVEKKILKFMRRKTLQPGVWMYLMILFLIKGSWQK